MPDSMNFLSVSLIRCLKAKAFQLISAYVPRPKIYYCTISTNPDLFYDERAVVIDTNILMVGCVKSSLLRRSITYIPRRV